VLAPGQDALPSNSSKVPAKAGFWNGALLKQLSLTAPTLAKKQLLGLGSFASIQTGTVRIRVSSSGRPVQIDGLGAGRD